MTAPEDPVLRGELHRIEIDLAVGAPDGDIWSWWLGGFDAFLAWCGTW